MSMQGGGYYNENSTLQGLAIDEALSLLEPPKWKGSSISALVKHFRYLELLCQLCWSSLQPLELVTVGSCMG